MKMFEIEELCATMLTENDEEAEKLIEDFEKLEEKLYDEYDVSFEQFTNLVEQLIFFTPLLHSPITDQLYHTFGVTDDKGKYFRAICKEEKK